MRYQAGVLIGEKFGNYKKFEKLRKRMRKFLNLIYEQSETLKKPRNGSLPNKVYLKQVNVVISRPGPAGGFFEKVPALFFYSSRMDTIVGVFESPMSQLSQEFFVMVVALL